MEEDFLTQPQTEGKLHHGLIWPETTEVHFQRTEKLEETLLLAVEMDGLSKEDKAAAEDIISSTSKDAIPYRLLRNISLASRTSGQSPELWLHKMIRGSSIMLPRPIQTEKSLELQQRLVKLQEKVDHTNYETLVEDVTKEERKEKDRVYLGSYKEQLGFGLHVIAMMFTGYVAGHIFFASLFLHQPVMHYVGGVLGLILGMLMEVVLFIIRSSLQDEHEIKKDRQTTVVKTSSESRHIPVLPTVGMGEAEILSDKVVNSAVRRRKIA